jgi:lipocalin
LWILARAPQLDAGSIAAAQAVVRANGYDVERLVMTPQAGAGH